MAYNQYGRLLLKMALEVLQNEAPWSLHLGGDDLLNTFNIQENAGFYSPTIAKPHDMMIKLLKEHPTFFLQPLPYDAHPYMHPESASLHERSLKLN